MHSAPLFCYARHMALSDQQLFDSLSRMPFIDSAALSPIARGNQEKTRAYYGPDSSFVGPLQYNSGPRGSVGDST